MKFTKKHLWVAICSMQLIAGCKHDTQDVVTPGTTATTSTTSTTSTTATTSTTSTTSTTQPANDSVCFNTQIQPLFNSSCAMSGCHDAITNAEGYNFTTYAGIMQGIVVGKPTQGKIMKEINANKMPQSPVPLLTAEQKALLVKWINEGAKNRICTDGCDPSNATFAAGVTPIITTNCVGCHNDNLASGGINLNGYANVKNNATTGKLICSIEQGAGCSAMPKNATPLNSNCIQLIKNWVNNGALNN